MNTGEIMPSKVGATISAVEILREALELPEATLSADQALADIEDLDSLGVLKVMALVDQRLGISLEPDQLVACETVNDLAALLQQVQ